VPWPLAAAALQRLLPATTPAESGGALKADTLLCAPLVYPWYLLWLTPFLVARKNWPVTIWTLSILVTYVAWRRVGVPWGVPVWAVAVQYGAVLAAALWVWATSPRPRRPTPPS
jgi:hypothetical protein